jgi:hypothetical protein
MSEQKPKDWNKTQAELFEEMRQGKRLIATREEMDRALEYERSLLPPGTVFPRPDQIWMVVRDCEVDFEVFFAAPGGGTIGRFTIGLGERVKIGNQTVGETLRVHFLPLRYDELEDAVVAPKVRSDPRYCDYAFYANTGYFNEHFRLVEEVP